MWWSHVGRDAQAAFLKTLKMKMKPLAGQSWCCFCHVTAAPRGHVWSLRNCQLAQGSWFKKKIWAEAYKASFCFIPYWAAKLWLNEPLRVQLSPGRATSDPRGKTSIIFWPWPHLSVSVSPSLVSLQHFETQRPENIHKERDNAVITQCCGYDVKARTGTMNSLCQKGEKKYGNGRGRNWIMTVTEWRVVDGRDLERFGKHSDIGMMVSV